MNPIPHLGEFDYLRPLLERAARCQNDGSIRPLPEPDPHSSIADDDAPLGGWDCSTLIRSSVAAGVAHVHALARLVLDAQVIDAFSPWTLLRTSLQDFATAVWLLSPPSRIDRQARVLALWIEDMRNRQQHEDDVGHVITGPQEKSGRERQQELQQRAASLGISRTAVAAPQAGSVIRSAVEVIGQDGVRVQAIWRVGSGFAHGRYWPNLRAATPSSAQRTARGFLVGLTIQTEQHAQLAMACNDLLEAAEQRYRLRASTN